jgi:putative membrane protein
MTLLAGSLLLRPYVFVFLLAFLAAAVRDLGVRRTVLLVAWVWPLAFLAEFSSTRTGIPFGLYHYTQSTRGRELFIADVPFFDSLSFTFLAYASFCLARVVLGRPGHGPRTGRRDLSVALLAGVLMMLLDVVIDPLAVLGDRWFLGHIFWYPHGGPYFGVPLSNFAGWFVVGAVGVGGYLVLARMTSPAIRTERPRPGVGLYYGVLLFNVSITAWLAEWPLLFSGLAIHVVLAVALGLLSRALRSRAGFARAILGGGVPRARGDRRKGGEAPIRG